MHTHTAYIRPPAKNRLTRLWHSSQHTNIPKLQSINFKMTNECSNLLVYILDLGTGQRALHTKYTLTRSNRFGETKILNVKSKVIRIQFQNKLQFIQLRPMLPYKCIRCNMQFDSSINLLIYIYKHSLSVSVMFGFLFYFGHIFLFRFRFCFTFDAVTVKWDEIMNKK